MSQTLEASQVQLLRRIAVQDRDALAEFYDQTARPLFSIAFKMLGSPEEAEEVIQDVFVQIWNKAATFDAAIGLPFHWALGIARNRCIDRLRARQRHGRVFAETTDETQNPALALPSAATESPRPETELAAIRAAVQNLPPDQRHAIELAFFQGLTHHEIAEKLEQPLGTIKARIRRGLEKLSDGLESYL